MIPARDKQEHDLFMKDTESLAFIRGWFDWTDENADILLNLRSIIGPPAIGRADGTAAFKGERGFIFLFNPNHRTIQAEFRLDTTIGLQAGDSILIRHLYPEKGKCVGAPGTGLFHYGQTFSMPMDGTSTWVLEVSPAPRDGKPILFNARGTAQFADGALTLSDVRGEIGTRANIQVLLPTDKKIETVVMNGHKVPFRQKRDLVSIQCRFKGITFAHNQAIAAYDPSFKDDTVRATFKIPKRIFKQLAERKKNWSIDWTDEDLECTWLASERLLLYLQIAEPDWKMEASMTLNGKPLDAKKAYSSRTPGRLKMGKGHNTFTGFYADVSHLKPDTEYALEVTLPGGLKPGQFQGVFFENVETEYTDEIRVRSKGD